ncbi:MAG: hypothetical protein ACJ73N_09285 [Bryobacteraceae bacterium]
MNNQLTLFPNFFRVQPTLTVSQDIAASEGKAPQSLGGTCLFSFVVSGLVTLLVCSLAPVRPISLPSLPKHLQGSGKTRWKPPLLNEVCLDNQRE